MAAGANDKPSVGYEKYPRDSPRAIDEHVIARELKSYVRDAVASEFTTVTKVQLDHILRNSHQYAKSGIQSVVRNVLEQMILSLLRTNVKEGTLNASISKFF